MTRGNYLIIKDEKKAFRHHMMASVSSGTKHGYESRLNTLRNADCTLDYNGLVRRVVAVLPKVAASTYNGCWAAVQWHLRQTGQPAMTDEQHTIFKKLVAGSENIRQGVEKPRGAITIWKLDDLRDYMRSHGASKNELFYLDLCFSTAARTNEMPKFTKDQFRFHELSGNWYVTMGKTHDPLRNYRAGRNKIEYETRVMHPVVYEELEARLKRMKNSDLIAPHWDGARMNNFVHETALHYRWQRDLMWDGVHCIRHGAAGEARINHGSESVHCFLGHTTAEGSRRYMKSNSERLADLKKNQAKAARNRDELAIIAAHGQEVRRAIATKKSRK